MKNIKPELNKDVNKKRVEYFLKGECPNVKIGKNIHTVKITIIKRFNEKHRSYNFYLNNLEILKTD